MNRRISLEIAPITADPQKRLDEIAAIIESVDNRCMASDGPIAPTLQEMRQDEISRIYDLAKWHAIVVGLDARGRCCGRKPLEYKRDGLKFCSRCDKSYDLYTNQPIENWAWKADHQTRKTTASSYRRQS